MSKIFCEICGTAYSENASQCPICGCPKPDTAEFSTDNYAETQDARSAPVKGGRFSKSNVNKRTRSTAAASKSSSNRRKKKKSQSSAERFLIIAIILLLIAIFVVVGYIYITYFMPNTDSDNQPSQTKPAVSQTVPPVQTNPTTDPTTEPTTEPVDLPCSGLALSEQSIRFNTVGNTWLLSVIPTPVNTTDTITFRSSDPDVATVDENGKVTAVGDGECIITIVCGDIAIECKVLCELGPAPTDPEETEPDVTEPEETEPEETQPSQTGGDFAFNTKYKNDKYGFEVTLSRPGEVWKAYSGDIDPTKVQWSTGNSSIAKVSADGRVTAVGKGYTVLRAVYNGVEYTCLICCAF